MLATNFNNNPSNNNPLSLFTDRLNEHLPDVQTLKVAGRVIEVVGTLVKAYVPNVEIGEICQMIDPEEGVIAEAEIVGFVDKAAILTIYGSLLGISTETKIVPTGKSQEIGVGEQLLGRVIDGFGNSLEKTEQAEPFVFDTFYPIYRNAPDPLSRKLIEKVLPLGIRALDGLLSCGEGQRLGIFAAAGVGKSTLLSSLVRGADADVFVIALIGERGREVREFIEHSLGEENRKKAVLIVATSDKSSMERARAAYVATAIAEYFRDQSKRVLFLMDSVTRFARALREIGLAAGEPPTRRGFPPSVFATLPKLMERAGTNDKGSITAFYTVLVEGDDMTEPVADETRSILDGHIILSRGLAELGHYPAIDVLQSASRVMNQITNDDHQEAALKIREAMALYQQNAFLIKIGEYQKGNDEKTDKAIAAHEFINKFLQQKSDEVSPLSYTLEAMEAIMDEAL